ncbi:xanthine permease XanP [Pelagibaculum spongiae]|uniref:Xanthine permease XanP n=2 Tax=Pelagibaculum spongiae TaxID=2080658 RepID=A0A2V1GZ51_9GAMM|nr:xanthine permease XanP [Pelagibaculum spongiae]
MSDANAVDAEQNDSELIYHLEDKPPLGQSLIAAVQHILAMVISVMAPPAIIATAMGVPADAVAYLISISLMFAGIGIIIQVHRVGGFLGSGMLSIQAVSFAFPSAMIAVAISLMKQQGLDWQAALNVLFGVSFVGGLLVMLGGRMVPLLRTIITPTVSGITVLMIGASLIKVGAIDMAGGFGAMGDGSFGDPINLALGGLVIFSIVAFSANKRPMIRMCALVLGILAGFIVAAMMGRVDWSILSQDHTLFMLPVPFKFGFFAWDWNAFFVLSFLFLVVVIEAIGDLTATSAVSEQPVEGELYESRLSGGIMCDGLISSLAAIFGGFPMATFSQNNGVIQLSGVASRKIGYFCGGLFILFALFPVVVVLFQLLPKPVLGGALVVLFGMIACSGVKILLQEGVDRRESIIIAVSVGMGIMTMVVPDAFAKLPQMAQMFFHSSIVTAGVTAMIVNQILPRRKHTMPKSQVEFLHGRPAKS